MRRGRMELALGRAVRAAPMLPEDGAAVELARQNAQAIDQGDLFHAGRALLEVLVQLNLTPKARASLKNTIPTTGSGLDELRQRRERQA